MTKISEAQKEYFSLTLTEQILINQKLGSTSFEDCSFINCDFSETEFRACHFSSCSFSQCNLSLVKFINCRFTDVVFEDSKVLGIDWTKAKWSNIPLLSPLKFFNCLMNYSSFMGLSLNELVIERCKALEVDLRGADLRDAHFQYTDFTNSLFNETNLTGADFTDAENYQINIHQNKIKGAKFSRYQALSLLESLGVELVD